MAIVDAEPNVAARTESLHIVVHGGRDKPGDRAAYDRTFSRAAGELEWPHLTALAPEQGDASRVYEVVATALDQEGAFVAEVRAISGYLPHEQLALHLLLEDSCIAKVCGNDLTCKRADCVTAKVEPTVLAEFKSLPRAKAADGGTAGASAGNNRDAGSVAGSPAGRPTGSAPIDASVAPSGAGGTGGRGPDGGRSGAGGDAGGNVSSDRCATDNGGCGSATYATCTNNAGASPTCTAINVCAMNNGGCSTSPMARCTNNVGTPPTCACPTGYGGTGVGSGGCTRFTYDSTTVKDFKTGRTWQRVVDAGTYTEATAYAYCTNLTTAGGGWRLPTLPELESIVDSTHSPSIDPTAFPNTPVDAFWSSSPDPNTPSNGWAVYFGGGGSGSYDTSSGHRVRCVR